MKSKPMTADRFRASIMNRLDDRIMNEQGPSSRWFYLSRSKGSIRDLVSMVVEEIGNELRKMVIVDKEEV